MEIGIRLILPEKANTYNGVIDMAGKPIDYDPFASQPKAVDIDPFAPKKRSWMDVPGEALSNIPSSAKTMATGLYQAVTSPVQTVSGLMDVAAGSLQNA